MSDYFDDTLPPNTEAATRGASRIRDLKTELNALVNATFSKAGTFLSKWISAGELADDAVEEDAIAAGAVTTAKLALAAVTIPKAGAGVAKVATGTYSGASGTVTVAGLGFSPDFLVVAQVGSTAVGIAFSAEDTGSGSALHPCYGAAPSNIGTDFQHPITWTADGFLVVPSSWQFNTADKSYVYLALKV